MTTMTESDAVMETLRKMLDTGNVGTVFGQPVTGDGVTVIPVAKVSGGGGGGGGVAPATGEGEENKAAGSGGGIGLTAKPVGVFVVKDGAVSWRPAVDVNKVIVGAQIVAVVALLTWRAIAKYRQPRGLLAKQR